MYCTKCGSKLAPSVKFCNYCGNPVAQNSVNQSPTQEPDTASNAKQQPSYSQQHNADSTYEQQPSYSQQHNADSTYEQQPSYSQQHNADSTYEQQPSYSQQHNADSTYEQQPSYSQQHNADSTYKQQPSYSQQHNADSTYKQQPSYSQQHNADSTYEQQPSYNQQHNTTTTYEQQPLQSQQVYEQANTQNPGDIPPTSNKDNPSDKKGLISLITGVASIPLALFFYVSIPLAAIAIFLGIKAKPKTTTSKVGTAFGIIGASLSVLIFIVLMIAYIIDPKPGGAMQTYHGDGYELKYDRSWEVVELLGGQMALSQTSIDSHIAPVGTSNFHGEGYDFGTLDGKKEIYDVFLDVATYSNPNPSSISFYGNNDGFTLLKDDIYYATIDYGVSKDKINGQYYILISEEKDIVLTFMSNSNLKHFDSFKKNILKLLKGIEIPKNPNSKGFGELLGENNNDFGGLTGSNTEKPSDNDFDFEEPIGRNTEKPSNNNFGDLLDNNAEEPEDRDYDPSKTVSPLDSFPGDFEEYMVVAYMDYKMPDCWDYSEEYSAKSNYQFKVFTFMDNRSLLSVKANTPFDSLIGEVGTSIEKMRKNIERVGHTIKSEDTKYCNGIKWYEITTEEYYIMDNDTGIRKNFYTKYFITLSKSNNHLYMFQFDISTILISSEREYMDKSIDYILNNANLYKIED